MTFDSQIPNLTASIHKTGFYIGYNEKTPGRKGEVDEHIHIIMEEIRKTEPFNLKMYLYHEKAYSEMKEKQIGFESRSSPLSEMLEAGSLVQPRSGGVVGDEVQAKWLHINKL